VVQARERRRKESEHLEEHEIAGVFCSTVLQDLIVSACVS